LIPPYQPSKTQGMPSPWCGYEMVAHSIPLIDCFLVMIGTST
jgi:hypothetical protein